MSQENVLFTNAEAAKFLRLEPKTLCCWRSSGKIVIPYIKVGGKVLYRKNDLEQFLEANVHAVA